MKIFFHLRVDLNNYMIHEYKNTIYEYNISTRYNTYMIRWYIYFKNNRTQYMIYLNLKVYNNS